MNINKFLEWAHQCFLESEEAQDYALSRGVSKDQCDIHNIGFIGGQYTPDPSDDPSHCDECQNRDKKHLWCDTCRYIRWSTKWVVSEDNESKKVPVYCGRILNSIVLPLTTYSRKYIGFQIRSITEKAYDTFALQRKPEGYFFGCECLHSIWSRRSVFLVEGPFDHLVFKRLVSDNVLALTTNTPGIGQYRFLDRFVDTIYCCLDNDSAGRRGLESINKYLPKKNIVKVQYPEKYKDIGKFWEQVGDVKFREFFRSELEKIGYE